MNFRQFFLIPICLIAFSCSDTSEQVDAAQEITQDPMAEEFFFMRNEEILEAILARLERENVEHWINDDDSVGFFARDAKTIDAIANAEIGNWVTLQ